MATIKDVASMAGVSVGSVSNYLNTPEKVKDTTRIRIQQAIEELNYTANPFARSIRSHRTNSIAVIMPDIINPFFAELYNAVNQNVRANGLTTLLYTTSYDIDLLRDYFLNEDTFHVDGVIMCYVDNNQEIKELIDALQLKIPLALITDNVCYSGSSSIAIDAFQGIYQATTYITSLGHKQIAYIGGPENAKRASEKYHGFLKAMEQASLEIIPEFLFTCDYQMHSGYKAARDLMMLQNSTPTALVAANDILAIGAMKYFLRHNIRVPDDIAVIGHDNTLFAKIYEPSLSSVAFPLQEMGHGAVDLLLKKINNPYSQNKQYIMSTQLIIRHSTDKNRPLEFEFDSP